MPQLNTPTFVKNQRPRPSSLNVPANLKPSDFLARKGVAEAAGVTINTPSAGMFNFDSLMEGGTGLTPVNPLIPCSTQNRNPMEMMLQTPTSEPSKLVSL
jgi:fos-like antigen, invertebrate